MNLYQLEYFIDVAKSLNISASAKKLFISQQALSSQIKKLEKHYNVKLFERTPCLKLTTAGEILLKEAIEIREREEILKKKFDDISAEESGEFTVGVSHTRGRVFLPMVVPQFLKRYPNVKIKLFESDSRTMKLSLENREIDILIAADNFSKAENTVEFLTRERLFWIASKSLCEKCNITDFSENDIKKSPLVLVNPNNRIRTIVDKYFERRGIIPNIITESDNIETTLSLAIESVGIALYPEMFLNSLSPHFMEIYRLVYAPLDDRSTDYDLVIVYRKEKYLTSYEKEFIKICKLKTSN